MNIKELAYGAFQSGIYKKNIHYLFDNDDSMQFMMVKQMAGSPGMTTWITQRAYSKAGIQIQVEKDVSLDLEATDFVAEAATVENVQWPSPVIELYFQDPKLPTILLMKTSPAQVAEWFPYLEVALEAEWYITALIQEGSNELGKVLSVQLKPDMWDEFLTTGETEKMATGLMSYNLSEVDNASMSYMLNLALKVLALASIPGYKPTPMSRKQMHEGKPGVKGRPNMPSFLLSYGQAPLAPPVRHETSGRLFKGRRGHIRWYMDPRYTNRRFTWDFIRPVRDPKTGKYPDRS